MSGHLDPELQSQPRPELFSPHLNISFPLTWGEGGGCLGKQLLNIFPGLQTYRPTMHLYHESSHREGPEHSREGTD